MQLIVCVTKHSDANLDKTTVFDKKYSMLLPEFYAEVESDVEPLYRQMNVALLSVSLEDVKQDGSEPNSDD